MNARTDIEQRIGIEPLDELLAKRAELVKQAARLRALYGSFGTWNDERKVVLARIAAQIRAQALLDGEKVTEAGIEEAAHAHDRYAAFVTQATEERARWTELEDQIQAITDRVMRDQALARFVSAEAHLA